MSDSITRMSVVSSSIARAATSISSIAVSSTGTAAITATPLPLPDGIGSSNALSADDFTYCEEPTPPEPHNLTFVKHENKRDRNGERKNVHPNRTDGNDSRFYDNWETGNWCWERKYDGNRTNGGALKVKTQAEDGDNIAARINNCCDEGDDGDDTPSTVASNSTARTRKRPRLSKAIHAPFSDNRSINNNAEKKGLYDDWVEGNWRWLYDYDNINERQRKFHKKQDESTRVTRSTRPSSTTRNDSNATPRKRKRSSDDVGEDFGSDNCSIIGEVQTTNSERPERKTPHEGRIATYNKAWMAMFDRLVAYKTRHKNTMVPGVYDKDPKLGCWVSSQRRFYTNNKLIPDRLELLNSIGFVWNGAEVKDEERWMDMYERLVAYKERHKNTMVPWNYAGDVKLAKWVNKQRNQYRNNNLSDNRCALLTSIGFVWKGAKAIKCQEKWMSMYHRLLLYKRKYNSTVVPSIYQADTSLGLWARTQRSKHKKLLKERFDLLESIGFVWDVRAYTK